MISEERIEKIEEDVGVLMKELKATAQSLLQTQKVLGGLVIDSEVETITAIINSQLQNVNLCTQIIADAAAAKAKLLASTTPLKVALDFRTSWHEKVLKTGAKVIKY